MGRSSASSVLTICCANRRASARSRPRRRSSARRMTSALSRLPGPHPSSPAHVSALDECSRRESTSLREGAPRFRICNLSGRSWPAGFYRCRYATTGTELASHDCPDGVAGFRYVFEDLVHDVFLEDPKIAVAEEILLEGFELEAPVAGHVA